MVCWSYGVNDHLLLRSLDETAKSKGFQSTGQIANDIEALAKLFNVVLHPSLKALKKVDSSGQLIPADSYSISSMYLDYSSLQLLTYLLPLSSLKSLKWHDCGLDYRSITLLTDSFASAKELKHIDISWVGPLDSSMPPMSDITKAENDRVKKDESRRKKIADGTYTVDDDKNETVTGAYAAFFSETSPLESVKLRGCNFTVWDFRRFELKCGNLKSLDLFGNQNLGDLAILSFSEKLPSLLSLENLGLGNCDLSDTGLAALMRVLGGSIGSAEEISQLSAKLKDAQEKAKKAKLPPPVQRETIRELGNGQSAVHVMTQFKCLFASGNFNIKGGEEIQALIPAGYRGTLILTQTSVDKKISCTIDPDGFGWTVKA